MPDTDNKLVLLNSIPLRLMGIRALCCPYELAPNDRVTFEYLQGDPKFVHIEAQALEERGLLRGWIYSRTPNKHIFTMTGYLGDFDVNVHTWKDTDRFRSSIYPSEAESIALLKLIDMKHVEGLRSIEEHKRRTMGLELTDITLEDAQKIYNAITSHCPKWP